MNCPRGIQTRTRAALCSERAVAWWLLIALLIGFMVLLSRSAAAQTERGIDLIERALDLKADTKNGRALYRQHCEACHGADAYGDAVAVIPALAGQLPVYLIKQLADTAEGQRTAPAMHRVVAMKPMSTPQGLRDVATYLGDLPPNPRPEVGDGTQLASGKRYYQGMCAYCHGAQGGGNEAHATPALRRQNYAYLLMQMRQLAVGHRYSVDLEIAESLADLSLDQLTAIADYASRLPMVDVTRAEPASSPGPASPAQ